MNRVPFLRSVWTIVDQALSSTSNFLVAVLVARTSSPAEFGAFSLGFGIYLLVLGVSRALASQPLLIRCSSGSPHYVRSEGKSVMAVAISLGAMGGLSLAIVSPLLGSPVDHTFLAFSASFIGVLVQDAWRFIQVCLGSPRAAALNDLAWTTVFVGLVVVFDPRAADVVLCWGLAGSFAGLLGFVQLALTPNFRSIGPWLTRHRDLWPALLLEFFAILGTGQFVLFGLSAVGGLSDLAALRAAQVLLGPLNVLYIGASLAVVAEVSRRPNEPVAQIRRLATLVSVGLATLALVLGFAMHFLPDSIGVSLVGTTWTAAHSVVLLVAAATAASGAIMGSSSILQGLGEAKRSLKARLALAPLTLTFGLLGAVLAGPRGAGGGLAIGQWSGAIIYRLQLRAALRALEPGDGPHRPAEAATSLQPGVWS
jgi:O-antigen/teichoic acid export membrane protein